jgi:hypothetical protein
MLTVTLTQSPLNELQLPVLKCGIDQEHDRVMVITGDEHNDHGLWLIAAGSTATLVGTLRPSKFKDILRLRPKAHIKLVVNGDEFEWAENEWNGQHIEAQVIAPSAIADKPYKMAKPIKMMKDKHYGPQKANQQAASTRLDRPLLSNHGRVRATSTTALRSRSKV